MRILASTVAIGCLLIAPTAQESSTPAIVAQVRDALGGDAALAGVTGFSMDGGGVWFSDAGTTGYSVRIDCELPDKLLVTRLQSERGRSIGERSGLNANDLIHDTLVAPAFPPPVQPPGVPPETAESKAAERGRQLLRVRQWFAALTLILFARSNAVYPLELVDAGSAELQEAPFRLLEGRTSGASGIRLFVHPVTHLPLVASWMATREPPALPGALTLMQPTDVAEALNTSPVEHQLHVGDYKSTDNPANAGASNRINWPRLFIEYVGGREVEEFTFRRVTLNPKFPPDRFKTTK